MYEVGGQVRDSLLGRTTKDFDFTAVVPAALTVKDAWGTLRDELYRQRFEVFLETPEYYTMRARFPADHPQHGRKTADFVLARTEGPYTDGRRPDWVAPGDLYSDLARRDFTINAMARDIDGTLIDPHGGQFDLEHKLLRCVGSASDRLHEDALRSLRAIRFVVTRDLFWDRDLRDAMNSDWLPGLLVSVSAQRKREELGKAFRRDTKRTMEILSHEVRPEFVDAVFTDGLWLSPSLEKV